MREMASMGDQYPGLEWRRAGIWESLLRTRPGTIIRVLSFDPANQIQTKITRYIHLEDERIRIRIRIRTSYYINGNVRQTMNK